MFAGIRILDQGSDRNRQDHILAFTAGAIGSAAFFAVFGPEKTALADVVQCMQIFTGLEDDVPAASAVAAGGAAAWHELFASERDHSITTLAGCDLDLGFVEEHGRGKLTLPEASREQHGRNQVFQRFPGQTRTL